MKKYGIMGGTFNPIHLAHLYIAYEAKETLNLDKVIFMVAGNPPHKKESPVIDSNYRCIGSYSGNSCNKISEVKLDHTNNTHQLITQ